MFISFYHREYVQTVGFEEDPLLRRIGFKRCKHGPHHSGYLAGGKIGSTRDTFDHISNFPHAPLYPLALFTIILVSS